MTEINNENFYTVNNNNVTRITGPLTKTKISKLLFDNSGKGFDNSCTGLDDFCPVKNYSEQNNNKPNSGLYVNMREVMADYSKRMREHDYLGAWVTCSKAIELNPKDATLYFSRACVSHSMEDYISAIVDYSEAIELDSKKDFLYTSRASARFAMKDYKGAIADYSKAIELNPKNCFPYTSRASVKIAMKDYKGAIADYSKAIELNPKKDFLYTSRAFARKEMKDYKGAIADYSKAIELNPNEYYLYRHRASAKIAMKDYKGAIADYSKAIELNPVDYRLYEDRAEINAKSGNSKEEIKDLETAKHILLTKAKEADKSSDSNSFEKSESERLENRIRILKKIEKTGFDFRKEKDYDIEEVHQGELGNCYFLAFLSKFPQVIKDSGCLKWNSDGSAEVSLYPVEKNYIKGETNVTGEKKTYHISKDELESKTYTLTKTDGSPYDIWLNPNQDMTLRALEIGYMKNYNNSYEKCKSGGFASTACQILFGNDKIPNYENIITSAQEISKDSLKSSIYLGCDKPLTINGQIIIANHAYIINGYDEETDMVSVSNPNCDDRKSSEDDINIPFSELQKNNFSLN